MGEKITQDQEFVKEIELCFQQEGMRCAWGVKNTP
jgi:hypothetical protein